MHLNTLTIVSRSAKVATLIDALNELAPTDEPELECEILVTVLYSCAGLEPLIKLDALDDVRKEHQGERPHPSGLGMKRNRSAKNPILEYYTTLLDQHAPASLSPRRARPPPPRAFESCMIDLVQHISA
jgi:hypothetical protein